MPYFVYIIECTNKAFYTGITNDLKRRLAQHKTGQGGHYTSYNPAVKIRYFEEHPTRSSATKREIQIKKWPRTKKLDLIKKYLMIVVMLVVILCGSNNITSADTQSADWITIPYGNLVDGSKITHSDETVRTVITKIPSRGNSYKGLVQQYLEPFSYLCNEKLSKTSPVLTNIDAYYPAGSEQPAWAVLFREGHFKLYHNNNLIRVFLNGTDPRTSFEKYRSVIRHPILDVMNSDGISIKKIEVYVFKNDYANTEIKLNTIPAVYDANRIDLSPKRRSLDLDSIEGLLKSGIVLEAAEADKKSGLLLYGKRSYGQTIGGHPVSISDLAVVYRSIFHCGYNSPYISLDKHEDNKYAKVNFGGHLENTRVGHVVLEADKLFKMLCTGMDPNTHKPVQDKISKYVPGFLTQNERIILEGYGYDQKQQIRYWFYPDEIGTVTDGSIGAVQSSQFLADAERMDAKAKLDKSTRKTIDHLNKNYPDYAKADNTYKELSTVGRLMAIVNWLKENKAQNKIELDDLLSVMIPASSTPAKIKKVLTVTAIAYPEGSPLSSQYVRNNTRTYYLSSLLDGYKPGTSDEGFLEVANNYFKKNDQAELYPEHYKQLKEQAGQDKQIIKSNDQKLNSIRSEIDRVGSTDIKRHNSLVKDHNDLVESQKALVGVFNSKIHELNAMSVKTRTIASIGGGISLDPKAFKKTVVNKNSPIIKNVTIAKTRLVPAGKVAESGSWVRNNPSIGGARINKLPPLGK